jgi:hypothetical protein
MMQTIIIFFWCYLAVLYYEVLDYLFNNFNTFLHVNLFYGHMYTVVVKVKYCTYEKVRVLKTTLYE